MVRLEGASSPIQVPSVGSLGVLAKLVIPQISGAPVRDISNPTMVSWQSNSCGPCWRCRAPHVNRRFFLQTRY